MTGERQRQFACARGCGCCGVDQGGSVPIPLMSGIGASLFGASLKFERVPARTVVHPNRAIAQGCHRASHLAKAEFDDVSVAYARAYGITV